MAQKNWSKATLLRRLAQTIVELGPAGLNDGDNTENTVEEIMLMPHSTILTEMNAAELVDLIRSAVIVDAIKR